MNYRAEKTSYDRINSLIMEANGDINLVIHCLNECKKEAETIDHNAFSYDAVKNKIIAYKEIKWDFHTNEWGFVHYVNSYRSLMADAV